MFGTPPLAAPRRGFGATCLIGTGLAPIVSRDGLQGKPFLGDWRGDAAKLPRMGWRVMRASGLWWVVVVALLGGGCDSLSRMKLAGGADIAADSQDARVTHPQRSLATLLERQGLPQTLLCSGTTWRAVGLGGFRNEQRLAPVKPGIAGYTLLHERGARRDEPPRLYIRAGERGPLALVYVRYEPAP